MDFSTALIELRNGKTLTRNVKYPFGYIVMQKGYDLSDGKTINGNTQKALKKPANTPFCCIPYLMRYKCMEQSENGLSPLQLNPCYLPTNEDLFANDWHIVI